MDKRDIAAMVNALEPMMVGLKDNKNNVDRPVTFMAIKVLLGELNDAATGMPAENNIKGILLEIEEHARGLAGLYPSYGKSEQDHYSFALNSISKLSMPTAFNF